MSGRKEGKVSVWIAWSSIKKSVLGIVLLAVMIGIIAYDMPTARTLNYWSLPLSGKIIAIDAGHGGPDGGAVSKNGLIEKDINLSVSLYLRDYLQQAGAIVVMTREGDYDLAGEGTQGYSKRKTEDLKQRVRSIEEKGADLFISVHMNSVPSNRWSGAQTFYYPANDGNNALAGFIQDELRTTLENTTRVAKTVNTVYLLKMLKMPAALVEVGFLSHPEESVLLGDDVYQRKVATSIYRGILRYASEQP
ncbi:MULTISPECIES: N-acetylmuramoyl-L-alanine amidase CwlD [unclassified Paenibacillus]|uniref:N-acetylmuramoyl-L-alanine amidase CwlD n=1 Tax=unclassified Paenibacillus TaxID=185978 RepID=UPI002407042C|nr:MULTISPECIES: N-acetylmuramoyl-L-alanine amidase CwlD [unclassified Paenibacillus]MDF9844481.1 N-acetylmuramoyl-L-alanine amidase [Paenibacillus sp. PastF-2]MDF9851085.1 N-acetylmuramoyl-L-alanine amidase [Paenibacillus sp. PastM-2]MDF9857586.1 N-acetylmuramoyl-L-alanine amidase [Paenibacillus sp. PastF-1]MDH6482923.1 N-acetylmuramoyl-L-alanine amidase [Paenibacillus sp. PastH-2]MDH6510348.1 N-acetylmuramoyl-L-alanine amidase [Paenibacillus sp. PastM-3]